MRERDRLWPERVLPGVASSWIAAAIAAAVLAFAYAPLLPELVHVWRTNEYAGHGVFVPVYSAFLLWIDRDRLRAAPRRIEPLGALVVLVGLALLALGRSAGSPPVGVVALAVGVAGAVLFALGSHVLRVAAFPLAFLVLMMPLPAPVVDALTLPIQQFAAAFASAALGLAGVPHHRDGIVLELPATSLSVAEGCNGLRFLMALVTLTAAFAQATQRTTGRKALLVGAALPVAVLANDVRITTLCLAAYYVGPHAAVGLTHHSIGKGVWAMALVPLIALGVYLRRRPLS